MFDAMTVTPAAAAAPPADSGDDIAPNEVRFGPNALSSTIAQIIPPILSLDIAPIKEAFSEVKPN